MTDDELGDGEDIDCFVMPQGTFTPSISVIRSSAEFSDFRIDFIIDIPPYICDFICWAWVFSTKSTPIPFF